MPEEDPRGESVEAEEEPSGPKLRHDAVVPLDTVGTPGRRWRCQVCELEGTMDDLSQKSCTRSLSQKEKDELAQVVTVAQEINPEWEGEGQG